MKHFILFSLMTTLFLSNSDCSKKKTSLVKYKGKLEIAGICMNYTIRLLEGNMNASDIVANWTDESTKKTYSNVFKLGNPCDFPVSIKQGDEFYFTIDTATEKVCTVCMAYYPTPPKALSIKVVQ
jgi:hypothetical protein